MVSARAVTSQPCAHSRVNCAPSPSPSERHHRGPVSATSFPAVLDEEGSSTEFTSSEAAAAAAAAVAAAELRVRGGILEEALRAQVLKAVRELCVCARTYEEKGGKEEEKEEEEGREGGGL
jgi:hypothetical protein